MQPIPSTQDENHSVPANAQIMMEAEASKPRVRKRLQDILKRYQADHRRQSDQKTVESELLAEEQVPTPCS